MSNISSVQLFVLQGACLSSTIWPLQCTSNISTIDRFDVDWVAMVLLFGVS